MTLRTLVLVLLAAAGASRAATYYVSQSSGDDSRDGLAAASAAAHGPWKTLARASIDYQPGDRILLKCGDTWNEEFCPRGSGTPANPIVIGSYDEGSKPLIDRLDAAQDRTGLHLSDQGGYRIVGLEFARCMTGVFAEYAAGVAPREYIWIEDCVFRDALTYQHYEDYPARKIGLGICFFSHERQNRIVLRNIMIRNCVFRRLASGVWCNSPDNFNKNASFVYNFGNMILEDCLFEEGYQWQMGIRGVAGGAVRRCVTHDVGRGFRAFNGVAGGMFFRCKDWVFEDSEWGFVDIGLGSGDGEAFDFEGNCDNMVMRNCLFHDTDGPGFLLCCYASDGHPNKGIRMENCVLNGKAKRPIGLPRCEIVNTTDWTESTWDRCRFYLSPGEALMRVMDPEKDRKSAFLNCTYKNLSEACRGRRLPAALRASSQAAGGEPARAGDGNDATAWKAADPEKQWLLLDFGRPTAVSEFRIKEDPSSSITGFVLQTWDERAKKWAGRFHGRQMGAAFVAPIVKRTTPGARLLVTGTEKGAPALVAFEAYDDPPGTVFNVARGEPAPGFVGR